MEIVIGGLIGIGIGVLIIVALNLVYDRGLRRGWARGYDDARRNRGA